MKSWIEIDQRSDFPLQNLPYGIFSIPSIGITPRVGVALGDFIIDMSQLHILKLLDCLNFDTSIFFDSSLNRFMALSSVHWLSTRQRLINLFEINGDDAVRSNNSLKQIILHLRNEAMMHIPANIGDYTDFYSSREHATNVGIMFRGKDNALQPNWLRMPIGYHGRSSSVVLSGTDVVRPCGQIKPANLEEPIFSPCQSLDFELELGFFVGNSKTEDNSINKLGETISIDAADNHIFGLVLLNDWSARDIQSFEYVPLGPFTGILVFSCIFLLFFNQL
jgi:fumarylacetoacetase